MDQHTFADGIGRIAVIDGIVRLDLVAHSPTETDPTGKPRAVFVRRIVMGMDQFLRASEKIVETARAIHQANARQPATQTPAGPNIVAPSAFKPAPMPPAAPKPAPAPVAQAAPQMQPQYRRESVHPDPPAAQSAAPVTPPAQPFP